MLQSVTEIALNTEERRLEAIAAYGLRGEPRDPALDDLARLLAVVCEASAAGIAFAGTAGASLGGSFGLDAISVGALPLRATMATEGVLQTQLAAGELPLEEGGPEWYAGARVETPDGVAIGCVFVLRVAPDGLTAAQVESMGALSRLVTTRLELTRRMREDQRGPQTRKGAEAALAAVLESVGDGIFGIGLDGRVTMVNPAATQMLGFPAEEMLGRNAHELFHHTRPDGTPFPAEECPILGSFRDQGTVRVADDVFWRKNGSPMAVEYVAQPQIETGQGEGRAVGVVVAFTDVGERDALDRMKDEFLSTISHELRTPLTSLRAALGLLTAGRLDDRPEKMAQMMEIAIANTDRLIRLVNDVLDLERIGSGKAEMHFVRCSMEEMFARAIALLEGQAAKAGLRFTAEANGVTVWADPERILQTLAHLLSNAIKFSAPPPGGVSMVRLRARSVAPDEALIEVEDQGLGIPADQLGEIFERFKQADASDTRSMGGTGLGLTICRSIVAQHGGQIWATSRPGQGSTFHFTLPTEARRRLR